jgi:phage terminase large subunit GpA-like protein
MNLQTANHPFARGREVVRAISDAAQPPRRVKPSDAARAYLRNDRGAWEETLAPEMVEPLNLLASREYTGIVFVGPQRSSKTFSLILGGISYVACCAPGDILVTQMSKDAARDFSKMEVDRMIRYSPEILARMSPRIKDNNTFDKAFRAGFNLKIGWPAVSQLSSKTLQYVFLTDYDRPENKDNVDGEGPMWDLAAKRTQTYMSRGKCLAESSPDAEIIDANWSPSSPHEAPPTNGGIMEIYNRGTRARRYWPCKHCGDFFEAKPGVEAFRLPSFEELEKLVVEHDLMALAERYARVYCPHCGGEHVMEDRPEMKWRGRWLHEGERINRGGEISGVRRRSTIASYWMGGVAATYQRWDGLLLGYLHGVANYVRTGDEHTLKFKVTSDFAAPYLSRVQATRRTPEEFINRLEDWERGTVPHGVRFLTAAADVQSNRFRVNVLGWGVELESWLIDRFSIEMSNRKDGDRPLAVNPASYLEDWELLIEQAVQKAYPVADREGLSMEIQLVVCDSAGAEGVTQRAYDFWRDVRRRGLDRRFQLIKGDNRLNAARAQKTWPDNRGQNRNTFARGDVPVWLLNVNALKDAIAGDLARTQAGPGYVHLPRWVDPEFFSEMTAEVKGKKGWENPKRKRNEDWDLHVYNRAAVIMLGAEKINWQSPPAWAAEPSASAQQKAKVRSLSDLARGLNAGVH